MYISDQRTCHIWGEPHFRTFDHTYQINEDVDDVIHFQGTCRYLVSGKPGNFYIYTEHEFRNIPFLSWVKLVIIEWHDSVQGLLTFAFHKGDIIIVIIFILLFLCKTSLCYHSSSMRLTLYILFLHEIVLIFS